MLYVDRLFISLMHFHIFHQTFHILSRLTHGPLYMTGKCVKHFLSYFSHKAIFASISRPSFSSELFFISGISRILYFRYFESLRQNMAYFAFALYFISEPTYMHDLIACGIRFDAFDGHESWWYRSSMAGHVFQRATPLAKKPATSFSMRARWYRISLPRAWGIRDCWQMMASRHYIDIWYLSISLSLLQRLPAPAAMLPAASCSTDMARWGQHCAKKMIFRFFWFWCREFRFLFIIATLFTRHTAHISLSQEDIYYIIIFGD